MKSGWHQKFKKSRADKRTVNGLVFDSTAEKDRYLRLLWLQQAGAISDLKTQVRFPLVLPDRTPIKIRSKGYPNGRQAVYTADFTYYQQGVFIVEEYKGFDTPESRFRRAVFEAIYKTQIRVTKGKE